MGCISSKNASCLMDQDDTPVQANPKEEHANSQNRVLDYSLEASTRHSRKSSRRLLLLGGSESSLISGGLSHYNRNIEAEQAAAGWPAWLCSAASEAVRGWVPLKAEAFQKLEKIGQGTYSSVFRAREVETGKMVALKKVKFDNLQQESIRFMAREILILRRLDHPNIMKLEGIVTSRASSSIYLVFEYMEHDLAGLSSNPDINFTESQIKCYMKQLLWGLEHCHVRGVIHRDIKASNILVNNKGVLKLGDFGLANVVTPKNKNQLTSRVVTLWYRAPELLMGSTSYGVSIDLWSVGCVFAEILMGKPILKGRTEIEQLHKIYKLCGSPQDSFWKKTKLIHATTSFKPTHTYEATLRERCKDLSTTSLFLLETLLSMEPYKRGTASSALHSEYFLTRPYACDPSSLPKYPPNKEMDAKYRDDMRRKRANLKLRDSGVSRKHKRPHRTEHDPKTYAKLPIRQDTFEDKNIPNETYRETAKTHENYYKLSDIPMTTGPANGYAWAEKRRKDPDNISTLTYTQPSSRSQLSETSVAFAKNTFGLDLKSDKDSVWEIQESDYDHVLEEVPREIKLSRIGERHGSFDGCGLDFSQREEDSPKNNLKHIQGGKQSISGPLIFKSGKIEEILKMNESNIRQAVRKSHFQREKDEKQTRV